MGKAKKITGGLVVSIKEKSFLHGMVEEARGTKIVIEGPGGIVPGSHQVCAGEYRSQKKDHQRGLVVSIKEKSFLHGMVEEARGKRLF